MCKTCSICCDEVKNELKTFCNHTFCQDCIVQWATKKNTCPLCREKNLLFLCKYCRKVKSEKEHKLLCVDCKDKQIYDKVDAKFEMKNIKKLQRDIKRRYKKLSLLQRIKLQIKSMRIKSIIKKSHLKIKNIIMFMLGTYQLKDSDSRQPYHLILTVLYSIVLWFVPGANIVVIASLVLIIAYNGLATLYEFGSNGMDNDNTQVFPVPIEY